MKMFDTVVIGAGQAGLAASYHLTQCGMEHLVLERGRVAESWRSGRWDAFKIATPNAGSNLPGYPYSGDDPAGYMTRDQLVAFFDGCASSFNPPLRCGITVTAVEQGENDYRVITTVGEFRANNVIVATGLLQIPKLPAVSRHLPVWLTQLHSSRYRNPASLPPGSVLVVGSGQSGTQIADDLHRSGRTVYLSIGSSGRVPRRYRGQDAYTWVGQAKLNTRTAGKFSQHAHFSEPGPNDLSLHALAARGVHLVGHLEGVRDTRLVLSADVAQRLAYTDQAEVAFKQQVDAFIAEQRLDAPEEPPVEQSRTTVTEIAELDLDSTGITVVVWATGYSFNFSWVKLPVFDAEGTPLQERGVTSCPGLYFLGLNWRVRPYSAFIGNVGGEAEHVANHIAGRRRWGGQKHVP